MYGTRTPLPDGRHSREYLAHLHALENEAKAAKRGGWGYGAAVKYWKIIVENLHNAGRNCGCISSTDRNGRQFRVVAAERSDAGRFIAHKERAATGYVLLWLLEFRFRFCS